MSKAARIHDVERTATMLDLVRRKYENHRAMSLSHVVIEECAPGTGFYGASRYADVLSLGIWREDRTLAGMEIKASRADLKRELADLSKHQAVARYCDTWTLVAWDESVLVENVPADWGVTLTRDGDHGRELFVMRKPEKRTPEPWPREFVCAMVRNAYVQSPGAAYVARVASEAERGGIKSGREGARYDLEAALRPLRRALFGENEYRWPKEAFDRDALFRLAAERLSQPMLGASA